MYNIQSKVQSVSISTTNLETMAWQHCPWDQKKPRMHCWLKWSTQELLSVFRPFNQGKPNTIQIFSLPQLAENCS